MRLHTSNLIIAILITFLASCDSTTTKTRTENTSEPPIIDIAVPEKSQKVCFAIIKQTYNAVIFDPELKKEAGECNYYLETFDSEFPEYKRRCLNDDRYICLE